MFCKNCGYKLKDEALFCPKCGTRARTAVPSSPDTPLVSVPSAKGQQSQNPLKPAPAEKSKGKRVGLFCCLGVAGVGCVAAAVVPFLGMQRQHQAGVLSASTTEAERETSITTAEAAEEIPGITEAVEAASGITGDVEGTPGVTEVSEETSAVATATEGSREVLSEATEAVEDGTYSETTVAMTTQETAQGPSMSQEELEAEVARIRQVWQSDRESISNGSFGHKELENHVQVYDLNGEIRMIEIPKGNGNDFSRTFQIEDGRLTFAFYDSPESQIRLYYKDDRLFRWIQTDAGKDAVIHDQESDNTEFSQNGQRALSEIYDILDSLVHTG